MTAVLTVVEATGVNSTRRAATSVELLGVDGFSMNPTTYLTYPLRPVPSSGITNTYERWFRFEFSGAYMSVSDLHFWLPSSTLGTGWDLRWGTTDTYAVPTNSDSSVAVNPVPSADPGVPNIDFLDSPSEGILPGTQDVTVWLVLQASATKDASDLLASAGLDYELTWLEY